MSNVNALKHQYGPFLMYLTISSSETDAAALTLLLTWSDQLSRAWKSEP